MTGTRDVMPETIFEPLPAVGEGLSVGFYQTGGPLWSSSVLCTSAASTSTSIDIAISIPPTSDYTALIY